MVSPTAATPAAPAAISGTLSTTDTLLAQQIDEYLSKQAEQNAFSGVVLVARAGTPLLNQGYGMASYEYDVPNTPQTKFRIGSLTKQFVAVAILQLQQQGLLDIQDSVCQYVDSCPEAWAPITLRHLLSQTSGLPNFWDVVDPQFKRLTQGPVSLLRTIRNQPLRFEPGAQFEYSNSNYVVLGYIVQRLAKTSLAVHLRDHILAPAGMSDSGVDNNTSILRNRATGYASPLKVAEYADMSAFFGAGDMYATAEDLLRWDQILYTDELLDDDLRRQMFASHTDYVLPQPDPQATRYGYGWFIDRAFGRQRIDHGGSLDGFKSELHRFPADNVTVIVLTNFASADPFMLAEAIEAMIFPGQ